MTNWAEVKTIEAIICPMMPELTVIGGAIDSDWQAEGLNVIGIFKL